MEDKVLIAILSITGIIILAFILLICFISLLVYIMTFYNANKKKSISNSLDTSLMDFKEYTKPVKDLIELTSKEKYEDVYITSKDNKKLHARYYHYANNAPIEIMFHGYKSFGPRDFAGGIQVAKERKTNALVVCQRGHGLSSGKTISFGIKERYDVIDWVNYVNNRFGNNTPIILVGISMGASTVLLASEFDYPSNVKCIIADCPYNSCSEIIYKVAKEMGFDRKYVAPFLNLAAKIYGHFNINEVDCFNTIAKTKLPILIIHGTADDFVPCQMSIDLKNDFPNKIQLELFEGAIHGLSYFKDNNRYKKVTSEFVNKYISK